ncbi:MAG: metal-sensing transcriptional repressor [Faecalibacterium sp.]
MKKKNESVSCCAPSDLLRGVADAEGTQDLTSSAALDATEQVIGRRRSMPRTPEQKRMLAQRLNRIEGQIRGIRNMIDDDIYCPDILVQVAAANAALNSFTKELLDQHLRTCVANDLREGNDESIDELLKVLQRLMR